MPGQEAYAAVRVGAFGSVLEIPFDGAAHVGQLAADLVVPAGVQFHFQQEIAVCGLDEGVFEAGLLAVFSHIGFVLGFVSDQVVREGVAVFGRAVGGEGPVGFVDFPFPEHLVKAFQGFGGFGKQDYAAHGPVQPVGDSHEYLPGLPVPLGDEGLEGLAQGFVSRLVSLHNLSRPLVENQQVVVFQQDSFFYVPVFFRAQVSVYAHNAAKLAFFPGMECGVVLAAIFF